MTKRSDAMEEAGREYLQEERKLAIKQWSRRIIGVILIFSYPLCLKYPSIISPMAPFLTLAGCILLCFDLAAIGANIACGLIDHKYEGEVTPIYSIPDSFMAKGDYEQAEKEYEKILEDFPGEVRPHIQLITIAVQRLKDMDLADRLFIRGRDMLAEEPEKQLQLEKVYEDLRSMLEDDDGDSGVTDLSGLA